MEARVSQIRHPRPCRGARHLVACRVVREAQKQRQQEAFQEQQASLHAVLARLDPDGDGVVDQNEFTEWAQIQALRACRMAGIVCDKKVIDKAALETMKPDAVLVNSSRGPIINETDLVAHLQANPDFRCGLDVFEDEPLMKPGLAECPNAVVAPHIARPHFFGDHLCRVFDFERPMGVWTANKTLCDTSAASAAADTLGIKEIAEYKTPESRDWPWAGRVARLRAVEVRRVQPHSVGVVVRRREARRRGRARRPCARAARAARTWLGLG